MQTLRWSVAVPLLILISNRAFLAEFGLWMTLLGIHFNAMRQFRMPSCRDFVVNLVLKNTWFFAANKIWHQNDIPKMGNEDIPRSVAFWLRMIRSLPSLFLCFWCVWLSWLMEVTTVQSLRQMARVALAHLNDHRLASTGGSILSINFYHNFHEFPTSPWPWPLRSRSFTTSGIGGPRCSWVAWDLSFHWWISCISPSAAPRDNGPPIRSKGAHPEKPFKTMPRQCAKVKLYKLKCGMLYYQHLGTEHFSGLDLNKFDETMDERYGKSQFWGWCS